ncbi:TonB-dependent receptor domain-containing protein [uncultured Acetobacteroides sp.]|uniref:TonB-dependent receptor n=1 Tax=uncultured Acetobacteroides sp. TaxID=1760811 RepID=UPI0029F46487|nr:TonB-dependent receptor [uncultured Acetobacteroides sp.]
MKIRFFRYVVLTCLLTVFASKLPAQHTNSILDKRITINVHNVPLKEALRKISTETGIGFSYSDELVSLPQRVTINVVDKPLKVVIDQFLYGNNTMYRVVGNQVVFYAKKSPAPKYNLSGYVSNAKNSERLIGCVVYDNTSKAGAVTNAFGYFSISLSKGVHDISFQHLGSARTCLKVDLQKDTTVAMNLQEMSFQLGDVTITNSKSELNLSKAQMGLMSISSSDIKKVPVLLGEADVMRAIQVMPGIQAANERSTGISVRGGSIDQNLFLLDDAPIFQISHLMGFYSVFNNDAVKDIKVYKGDIPANYGGRLSSVVDVRLRDGNMQGYSGSAGVGFVASDLSIEGPIVKDRVSFIASGKASYMGFIYHLINRNMNLAFYDLNGKVNAILSNKDRLYISSYIGGDKFGGMNYQNTTLSLRWNHIYNPKLFSNVSLIYSNFKLTSTPGSDDDTDYLWKSGIGATTLKAEYNYFLNNSNTIDFGVSSTFDCFYPGRLEGSKDATDAISSRSSFSNRIVSEKRVLDHAVYISNQQKLTDKLSVRYGIRASLYQVLGGHWVYNLDNYQLKDSFYVAKNHTYANRFAVEPRVGLNYRLTNNSAIKASYSYTTQQSQLLVRSNGGGPLDIWFPSNNNIKPQTASQFSCGYVHYLFDRKLEACVEGYYKDMHNIIDYKDGASVLSKGTILGADKTSYNFEEQLRVGKGYSYGVETELKWSGQRINGFVSYAYARSKRKIDDINGGSTYLSPFDKPHTVNLFVDIPITKRLSISANYRYQSGQVTTVPIYMGTMFDKVFMEYSNRNEYRLPYYSRIDLSMTLKNKEKPGRRYRSEWNFSIINLTNHSNIQYIKFVQSKDDPSIITAKGINMLGLLPSVSYRIIF